MWNDNATHALGFYKKLTWILGIWPLDKRDWSSISKNCVVILTLLMLIVSLIGNWTISGNCASKTELIDVITIIACSFIGGMQMSLILRHRRIYKNIITSAVEDWTRVHDNKCLAIMQQFANIGRIFAFVQMIGAYLSITPVILTNLPVIHQELLDNDTVPLKTIPGVPKCWIPIKISLPVYYSYHLSTCIGLFIGTTVYTGCTVFMFGLAMHLVGQLESLNHSLDDVDHLESQEIDDKLAKLSMRHSLLLDLAKGFHTCTNVVIFLILGSNTFIICLSEVMLLWAFNAGDNQTSVDMIIRISLMSVQIFLYSYIGEKFSIQSSKLKLTLYNCPWYKIPPRVARNLQFIMMRNNIPLRLTAGKICVMDFENFKNILKSMFSYFSILRLIFPSE